MMRGLRGLLLAFASVSLALCQNGYKAVPPQPKSTFFAGATFDKHRYHKADGDMWPLTWAADDNMYGSAGDNQDSPMNFWKITGNANNERMPGHPRHRVFLVDNRPIDPAVYCQGPNVDHRVGIKPAGLLSVSGVLYYAVETMNYGDNPAFNRQHNINGWIITSTDFGKTWKRDATPTDFFTRRLASTHFLQFGKDYADARDEFVYAYFPAADDGASYWDNGDYLLLGRVPKDKILVRHAWEFYAGLDSSGPAWSHDDRKAEPIFRYPRMTGENHVTYNKALKRYLMGNFSFHDGRLNPRPYHQLPWPASACPSQLTLYEAPEPWGPWSLFYRDDDWGACGDYQPSFPSKWMSADGKTLWMVSAGTFDDYNFTLQQVTLTLGKSREQ